MFNTLLVITIITTTCWDTENETRWLPLRTTGLLEIPLLSERCVHELALNFQSVLQHWNACKPAPTSDCRAPAGSPRSWPTILKSKEGEQGRAELGEQQSRGGEVKVGMEGVADTAEALPSRSFAIPSHRDRGVSSSACQPRSATAPVLRQEKFSTHDNKHEQQIPSPAQLY